jgi:hypothetical protein
MRTRRTRQFIVAIVLVLGCASGAAAEGAGAESKRLGRAKDLIADEQWSRAIDELRIAVADAQESRKDEVLYWLAHSLNQSGDRAAAVDTIGRLERDYPKSMWVKPARALRLEIAVRLNRSDVLWSIAMPPPAPGEPAPVRAPRPIKRPTPAKPGKADPSVEARTIEIEKEPWFPAGLWYADSLNPDLDLKIQALGALMKTDADRVMPLLRDIAFESPKPEQASRAVFMLAQSDLPRARQFVVEVAKTAPEPAQMAAVKALGRLGGPQASQDLMQVYVTAKEQVKFQIVSSLGERAEKGALLRIVELEKDGRIRYKAIEGLGQAGAVVQLASMYKSANLRGKRSIIIGLFIARADDELIRIAELERPTGNDVVCQDVYERLRLLNTPKAKDYLQKVSEKR